eukprot:5454277-Pleurochrysis_carterae.AAC.1
MVNNISPTLLGLLNNDYFIPSGENKDDIVEELKKVLCDEERVRKKTVADARAMVAAGPSSAKKRKSCQGSGVAAEAV